MNKRDHQRKVIAEILTEAFTRVWVLETMLDQAAVGNWRELAQKAEAALAPEVRARLQPLVDDILGQQSGELGRSLPLDWQQTVRGLVESARVEPPDESGE